MQWYIPITIIPGIGLIIMSTSNLLIALTTEVTALIRIIMVAGVLCSLVAIAYLISFGFRLLNILSTSLGYHLRDPYL